MDVRLLGRCCAPEACFVGAGHDCANSPPHTANHSFQRAQEMATKRKAHEANEAPLHCLTYLESMLKGFRVNEGERQKKKK